MTVSVLDSIISCNLLCFAILYWWFSGDNDPDISKVLFHLFWVYSTQPFVLFVVWLFTKVFTNSGIFSLTLFHLFVIFGCFYYFELTRVHSTILRDDVHHDIKKQWRTNNLIQDWGTALKRTESRLTKELIEYIELKKQELMQDFTTKK